MHDSAHRSDRCRATLAGDDLRNYFGGSVVGSVFSSAASSGGDSGSTLATQVKHSRRQVHVPDGQHGAHAKRSVVLPFSCGVARMAR